MIKNKILITGKYSNRAELVMIKNVNHSLSSRLCNTLLPETGLIGYSVTNIQEGKVILAGGYRSYPTYDKLATAYEGNLNYSEDDLNWTKLPSMEKRRSPHAAFYRGNKLYIVWGSKNSAEWFESCEVFEVTNRFWSNGPNVPYALLEPKAVTSQNQSFSLILGMEIKEERKLVIMIFDQELNFKEIASFKVDTFNSFITEIPIK